MSTVLPKHVQEQLDAADALVASMNQATTDPAPPAPAPAPPEPAPVEQPAPAPEPPSGIEQKYRTLQGKYDAEVPRLHEQTRMLAEQLKTTTDALAHTSQALAKSKEAPPAPEVPAVTGAEEEAFGKDLIDVCTRIATAAAIKAANQAIDTVRQDVAALEQRLKADVSDTTKKVEAVTQRQVMTDQEKYFNAVVEAFPKFMETLKTPAWEAWMAEIEPTVGVTRQVMLDAAYAALDLPRTLAILKYCSFLAPASAAPTPPSGQAELQLQEAPSGSGGSNPVPAETRIWTGSEYNAAFDPRIANTGRTREQINVLQAEADRAQVEGRVDWGR